MICPICDEIMPVRIRVRRVTKEDWWWHNYGACNCGRIWGINWAENAFGFDVRRIFEHDQHRIEVSDGFYRIFYNKGNRLLLTLWELS